MVGSTWGFGAEVGFGAAFPLGAFSVFLGEVLDQVVLVQNSFATGNALLKALLKARSGSPASSGSLAAFPSWFLARGLREF